MKAQETLTSPTPVKSGAPTRKPSFDPNLSRLCDWAQFPTASWKQMLGGKRTPVNHRRYIPIPRNLQCKIFKAGLNTGWVLRIERGFASMSPNPHLMKSLSILRLTALASLLTLAGSLWAEPIPAEYRIGGFAIGCQAYTFNRFTAFEAIEKTESAGGKVIEFYPGQAMSPEDRTTKLDHEMPAAAILKLQEKLKKHGLKAVNYGVVTIPKDAAAARKLFQFAKGLGLYAITTESTDAMDTFEPLVKEFDIRVAFHNHAQQPKNPAYKVWDPKWVADLVRNRDSRIGACADIGHWQTSGIKAVDGLRMLEGRVISLHAKEREQLGHGQRDMIFGTGSTDMGAVLAELRRQKFDGNISCEYEFNWDHSVPDVAQCIGFVRGWSAGNR